VKRSAVYVAGAVVAVVMLAGGIWLGARSGGDDGPLRVDDASGETSFDYDYVIPEGTAERIAAGEDVEIVPREMTVHVGESIRIVNHDVQGHLVGVFYVGAGESLTKTFASPGVLAGECTIHPSGQFTLRVEA